MFMCVGCMIRFILIHLQFSFYLNNQQLRDIKGIVEGNMRHRPFILVILLSYSKMTYYNKKQNIFKKQKKTYSLSSNTYILKVNCL
jgi:hypothetical protein